MSESWGDFFTRVGSATLKVIDAVGAAISNVEVGFDANRYRGVGILWSPRTNQVLYYSLDWSHHLDLRGRSDFEIQVLNVLIGLSMWEGFINANRVARDPVIKIPSIEFIMSSSTQNEDVQSLLAKINNCVDGISVWSRDRNGDDDDDYGTTSSGTGVKSKCWEYISPSSPDEKFKQVRRLANGQDLSPTSSAFQFMSLIRLHVILRRPEFQVQTVYPLRMRLKTQFQYKNKSTEDLTMTTV